MKILNGGFPQWQKDRLPQASLPTKPIPKHFIPTINPKRLATKFSTRLAIDDRKRVIIDSRSQAEYQGLKSKANRYGRIPNAISIPWSTNFSEVEGIATIKPIAELKNLYADIDPEQGTITYCNKGKQAALTYFILRLLGHNVASYDGSWIEWGNDPSLPIENP